MQSHRWRWRWRWGTLFRAVGTFMRYKAFRAFSASTLAVKNQVASAARQCS
jgi:hypothetical protein